MARSPLARLVRRHQPVFDGIADAWLAAGACGFGIWDGDRCAAHWPAQAQPRHADERAQLALVSGEPAFLAVAGLRGPDVQRRLAADAGLITALASHEAETDAMTAELIDTQDQLLALYELSRSMRSHVTVGDTLDALAREAARLVKAPFAVALLAQAAEPLVSSEPAPLLSNAELLRMLEQFKDTSREWQLRSTADDPTLPANVESVLLLPIQVRGATSALLGLLNKPGGFAAPDLKLSRAIADHAGAQIDNVLLYQETLAQARLSTEMDLARKVQLQLLPQSLPAVPGIELAARSLPASLVGGDFFDVIYRRNRPLILTIGDVTGKGLSAALVMAMTRRILRSKASFLPDPNPRLILARASEDLYDDFSDLGMLATTVAAQYEPDTGRFVFANAGHAPVIYRPAGEAARLLEADGTALGVFEESYSENQVLTLRHGDLFVIATDGFTEARAPDGTMFGYEQLLRTVDCLAAQPATAIADGLFAAIEAFAAGSPQDDDQTLVVLKRTA